MSEWRSGYLHELPRVPKDDLFAVPPPPSLAHTAEAEAIARVKAARPGAHWSVGVDHRGVVAIVDGHEARRRGATCAELLILALEKALSA